MREGMLHIRDVEGPKKTGSMETWLEAMEQQVFKCQGMVERGLNANHMMITEFTNKHMIDANDIGKHLSRLYDRIDQLQAQIYDLQNQNYDWAATLSRWGPRGALLSDDDNGGGRNVGGPVTIVRRRAPTADAVSISHGVGEAGVKSEPNSVYAPIRGAPNV
ncbi:40S ribosomal protein S5-1 [Hordeum vulgare]|nr:40S ribosomal protein S5-1 [Hordeum vulgare]